MHKMLHKIPKKKILFQTKFSKIYKIELYKIPKKEIFGLLHFLKRKFYFRLKISKIGLYKIPFGLQYFLKRNFIH